MPRFRRTFRRTGARPRYQWRGFQQLGISVGTSVISLQLVPPVNDITNARNATHVRTHLCFGSNDLDASTIDTVAFCVQHTEFDNTGTPVGVIDPLSTSAFDLANGDVLDWCYIPTAGRINTRLVMSRDIKAQRRLQRGNHGIIVSLKAAGAATTNLNVLSRSLLRYS